MLKSKEDISLTEHQAGPFQLRYCGGFILGCGLARAEKQGLDKDKERGHVWMGACPLIHVQVGCSDDARAVNRSMQPLPPRYQ
jgi:hypothetical protein